MVTSWHLFPLWYMLGMPMQFPMLLASLSGDPAPVYCAALYASFGYVFLGLGLIRQTEMGQHGKPHGHP